MVHERRKWIDLLKFMAIIAVLTDHTYGTLYTNQSIWYLSWFSVPLFVIVSGYNCYSSMVRHRGEKINEYLFRSLNSLLFSYACCVLLYEIFNNGSLNLVDYLKSLVTFSSSVHFYYVLMHVQLIFAGYYIFRFLARLDRGYKENVLVIATIVFSVISVKYTNIMDLFGGGGKLFGGGYLVLFLLGGITAKHELLSQDSEDTSTSRLSIIVSLFSVVLFLCWWRITTVFSEPIETIAETIGLGCRGIELCGSIMGIFAFAGFGGILRLAEKRFPMRGIFSCGAFVGRNCMSIFLYHMMIFTYLNKLVISNIILKGIVYFTLVIVFSIVIDKFFVWIKHLFRTKVLI